MIDASTKAATHYRTCPRIVLGHLSQLWMRYSARPGTRKACSLASGNGIKTEILTSLGSGILPKPTALRGTGIVLVNTHWGAYCTWTGKGFPLQSYQTASTVQSPQLSAGRTGGGKYSCPWVYVDQGVFCHKPAAAEYQQAGETTIINLFC